MIPPPPGNVKCRNRVGALAAGSAIGFVLERDRQPDPVAGNLAVLDGDVLAGHFGDARVADCRRGGLDRAASSMLPRLGARADDLGHAVDPHVLSFSWVPADHATRSFSWVPADHATRSVRFTTGRDPRRN